ncbi:hypothetical protein H4CHR_04402 [Variovorax sp. PBS-H4]|uniref:hypothetical protein n=1 Tax=Variovorax sp. PBS-H4 TaxID=434008 RepID=UPI00131828A7|nr:hypothetical protein [Variovorax sp. PBS-H4]VTU38345.1 hypothetical protein H4CHR_04402 [Variovorax sp. PBS-H4]
MSDYRKEFPRFGALDVTLPEGLVDHSWRDDICPSFCIPGPDFDRTGVAALTLFIDYADLSERENKDLPRFAATTADPCSCEMSAPWLHTDDWEEVVAWIAANRPKEE